MRKTILPFLAFVVTVTPVSLDAQTSAFITEQSLGARAVALGESYVAVTGDAFSQYWNPAGIRGGRDLQLAYTHRPSVFAGILNYEYFTGSYTLNSSSTLGIHFNYLDIGESIVATRDNPGAFKKEHSFNYVAGITYARRMTNGLTLGLTLKSIYQRLTPLTAQSWAGDVGLIYSFGKIKSPKAFDWTFDFGASLSNIGEGVSFIAGQSDPLPRILRLGLAHRFLSTATSRDTKEPMLGVLLVGEYQNLLNADGNVWEWGVGAEMQTMGIAALRVGYHEHFPKADGFIGRTFETGWTYGFGVNAPLHKLFSMSRPLFLNFDFASAPQNGFVRRYEMFTVMLKWGGA